MEFYHMSTPEQKKQNLPKAIHSGELPIMGIDIKCHVVEIKQGKQTKHLRVLSQGGMFKALGKSASLPGGRSQQLDNDLPRYPLAKNIQECLEQLYGEREIIGFHFSLNGNISYGFEGYQLIKYVKLIIKQKKKELWRNSKDILLMQPSV